MSTRGAIGFVIDGDEKLTYNHSDSYPSYLGVRVLDFCRKANWSEVREQAARILLVDENKPPTPADVKALVAAGATNLNVSEQSLDDWYCLMREAQGELGEYLKLGLMPDGNSFPLDSLFCEYAYVIDLDANMLEVYKGFQHEPHDAGRFSDREPSGLGADSSSGGDTYYPVAMVAAYSLTELPDDAAFLATVEPDED